MASLFGWKFEERNTAKEVETHEIVTPDSDDGASFVSSSGVYETFLKLDNSFQNEFDLISRYRSMAMHPECELAIDEIVNEAIVTGRKHFPVLINLDFVDNMSEMIKDRISDEFYEILSKLNFKYDGYEIFRRWFVDGRLYYHVLIDVKNPKKGIVKIVPVDSFKIKKVKEKATEASVVKVGNHDIIVNQKYHEYFVFSDSGLSASDDYSTNGQSSALKLSPDSIVYVTSGLLDERRSNVISYLHKAYRPLNQIRLLEDSAIIYRLSRAPSRRVFYIDVGNLPKPKAEQYMYSLMNQYRNKMVYDNTSGTIRDARNHQSLLEDYWLPRRNGSATTEIDTLASSDANFTQMEEIEYFQKLLFRSLNVPLSRMQAESGFSLGRASEISRDEYKFLRFIERLRTRFSFLFLDLLKRQLILKEIMTLKQWNEIKDQIIFEFDQDSNFNAMKDLEMLNDKMNVLRDAEEYRGKYFSAKYIRKYILGMSDEEIEMIDEEIENEKFDSKFTEGEPAEGGFEGGYGGGFGGDSFGGEGGFPQREMPTEGGMTNDFEDNDEL